MNNNIANNGHNENVAEEAISNDFGTDAIVEVRKTTPRKTIMHPSSHGHEEGFSDGPGCEDYE